MGYPINRDALVWTNTGQVMSAPGLFDDKAVRRRGPPQSAEISLLFIHLFHRTITRHAVVWACKSPLRHQDQQGVLSPNPCRRHLASLHTSPEQISARAVPTLHARV